LISALDTDFYWLCIEQLLWMCHFIQTLV